MPRKKMGRTAPLTIEEASTKANDDRTKKCRYCTNEKDVKRFYKSFDFLDTDGKMSICIDCCVSLFNHFYSTHSRIDIAIYELCRILNVKYCSKCYSSLMRSLEKNSMQATVNAINGEESEESENTFDEIAVNTKVSLFGKYVQILRKTYASDLDNAFFDLYSNDRPEGYEDRSTGKPVKEVIEEMYTSKISSLERKWGKGYEEEDIAYLESEYSSWAKTKDVDEKGVDILIKELCCHLLKMRKLREDQGSPTKADIDMLTSMMDKCNVTPDRLKDSGSNKNAQAFGTWLKDVETMSPAEWIENKKMFKDVEGIGDYVDRHFDRALKNYIGMQRDFRVVAAKMDEEAGLVDFSDIEGLDLQTEEEVYIDAEQNES